MLVKNKTELTQKIMESQHRIGRYMKEGAPEAWLALNLTIAQLKTLMFVNFEGVTNFKKLAAALGTTPPNVTGIIDRLVEQGLVSREYNQQNRRMQMLKLTEKAEVLLNELHQRATAHLTGILSALDIEDLSALAQGLDALANAAEKYKENQAERLKK
jgi:MarR family transcriptional regulator, organic hydroperoxide resistance regulator